MSPDVINGCFEIGGAAVLALNVKRLHRDRRIAGVHWGPTLFFALWGLWNLFYYPSLGQWWSTVGGCLLVLVNIIWLVQLGCYGLAAAAEKTQRDIFDGF